MNEYFQIYEEIIQTMNDYNCYNQESIEFFVKIFDNSFARGFMTDFTDIDNSLFQHNHFDHNYKSNFNSVKSNCEVNRDECLKPLNTFKLSDKLLFEVESRITGWMSVVNLGLSGTTPWLLSNCRIEKNIKYWIHPKGKLSNKFTTDCLFKPTGKDGGIINIPERILVFICENKTKIRELPGTPEEFLKFVKNINLYFGTSFWSWRGFAAYIEK